ncbi:hypothetical protein ACRB68_53370 [Actinomadura sp. RB68]|uniref:Uncharacterized protein n=1 Tax=Actinomadura macrotermitis TaxID=2585200 RepID=A0A7K0C1B7_9ACTN|nr:hypothetical protein [Actinomadura macrotermitis]
MRHNGRDPISLSDLLPSQIDIPAPVPEDVHPKPRTLVTCLDCGSFQPIKRHMIHPHRRSRLSESEVRAMPSAARPLRWSGGRPSRGARGRVSA